MTAPRNTRMSVQEPRGGGSDEPELGLVTVGSLAGGKGSQAGPYEHTGAYVGSELFDTSGVPADFCPDCEHAPCVAGRWPKACKARPRYLVITRIQHEIDELIDLRIPDWRSPHAKAFRLAVSHLGGLAGIGLTDFAGRYGYQAMVDVLVELRPKDES